MSFLDSIRETGGNVFGGIDDFGDDLVDGAKSSASNFVGGVQLVGATVTASVEATRDVAVRSFQFQAAVTRVGLERAFDGAQFVGETTSRLASAGLNRFTHPGDPTPPAAQGLDFSETKSAAGLAYDARLGEVYRFPDGGEWRVVDVSNDSRTGFRAIALKPLDAADDRVIVSFAGTRDGKDWLNNIGQGAGLPTAQYNQAVRFADKWKASDGANVILTGHSLGGGLASYASVRTGLRATAVNSAPLALNHLGLNPAIIGRVTQYYVPGEALSILNAKNPLDVRPGNQIAVQGRHSIFDPRSPVTNHSLGNVAPGIPDPVKVD